MKRLDQLLDDFQRALDQLNQAVGIASTDLEKDGVIQRFEFTFELCWKTIRRYLDSQGLRCNSPRSCLKEAFQAGLIRDEDLWLQMLADRNASTHIYDEQTSRAIFGRIRERYTHAFGEVLSACRRGE